MSPPSTTPSGAPERADSDRVRLARAARDAALRVPGVVGTDAGPLGAFLTAAGDGERLEGVVCIASSSGAYDVSLRLSCGLVPLQPLSERVRAAVGLAAARTGVELASVSVHFASLLVAGEL